MKRKVFAGIGLTAAAAFVLAHYITREQAAHPAPLQGGAAQHEVETAESVRGAKVLSGQRLGSSNQPGPLGLILAGGSLAKPTPAQLDAYLQENGRSSHSLLGAFRATGDPAYLHEAMQTAPNSPQVQYAAYFFATDYKSEEVATPERRKWLEALKSSDPDNALPGFLSARDYFKAGQPEKALQELKDACARARCDDYSLEYMQNAEEAYVAAGESPAAAKMAATLELPLPHLAQLRDLSQRLADMAGSYRGAGDAQSAQAVLELGLGMSQIFSSDQKWLINELVGVAVERNLLGAMDKGATLGDGGPTVQARLDELMEKRESLKALGKNAEGLLTQMHERDIISFMDRWRTMGETAALRWAIAKYGERLPAQGPAGAGN